MPRNHALHALFPGLASGVLYLLIYGNGLGIALMLLPSFPLLMVGLSMHASRLLIASASGTALVLLLAGAQATLFYAAFTVIPVLLFAPAVTARPSPAAPARPVGEALCDLSVYAALVFAAMILHYADQGGLRGMIVSHLTANLPPEDGRTQEMLHAMGGTLAFFILAASGWWWVFLLYAHAWLANAVLKRQNRSLRENLRLTPFTPPFWLPIALTLLGFGSLSAGENIAFLCQTLLLILLFPYFLSGVAWLQEASRAWPQRGWLLFGLYFLTFSLVWPALVIAAAGVWRHCRTLLGR